VVIKTLIDDLLDQQQQLQTPVAKFANLHEREPDLAGHYRNLIPLTRPNSTEQYAFEVSLDRCTGCKACVSACHSLNGLDADESWRDVGLLVGGDEEPTWQQTLTSSCHHCESPECLHGCPVGAYEKDQETGIVRHLDDQCIGCSYCILKCPFDVPKYSRKRGIVRKCDMCHSRLAEGEAPACVQACPTEAIRIVKVDRYVKNRGVDFIPGAPDPSITLPTTRYIGKAVPSSAKPVAQSALIPEQTHWPLVFMLTLTQAGAGLLVASFWLLTPILILGTGLFFTGMATSVLHLGKPLGAWRFFLGLKTSWLSREILAFSMLAGIISFYVGNQFLAPFIPKELELPIISSSLFKIPLIIFSVVAIFTSVMIYADTKRIYWNISRTSLKFFSTMLLFAGIFLSPSICLLIIVIKLSEEFFFMVKHCNQKTWTPHVHTAKLQSIILRKTTIMRVSSLLIGSVTLFFEPYLALLFLLAAEILERKLFFESVYAPRMTSKLN
jgi:formate dehydrogenase iron-sulfur subunit